MPDFLQPTRLRESLPVLLAALALLCLVGGGVLYLAARPEQAALIWLVGAGSVFVVLVIDILRALLNGREMSMTRTTSGTGESQPDKIRLFPDGSERWPTPPPTRTRRASAATDGRLCAVA
ncbi:MAG: hypothetical protein ACJLUP_00970 [Agrobacterium tumefaciens]